MVIERVYKSYTKYYKHTAVLFFFKFPVVETVSGGYVQDWQEQFEELEKFQMCEWVKLKESARVHVKREDIKCR